MYKVLEPTTAVRIDSASVGHPAKFRTLEALVSGLAALPGAPRDVGSVVSVVIRGERGLRQTPERVQLTRQGGVVGDAWGRREHRNADGQIAVMQGDVAALIANGQPLALSGDSLFLALDLSAANLPPGSTLRVGTAVLQVTPKPHDGCSKFRARFGEDALRFTSTADLRHRNLRGVYMRVVEDGETGPGDPVGVVTRASPVAAC